MNKIVLCLAVAALIVSSAWGAPGYPAPSWVIQVLMWWDSRQSIL